MSHLDQVEVDIFQVDLDQYVGGQAQIQDDKKKTLIRAHIKKITISDVLVKIEFDWAAENTDCSNPSLGDWQKILLKNKEINLELWQSIDLGSGRLSLESTILKQKVVLLNNEDTLLEKSQVKGLT